MRSMSLNQEPIDLSSIELRYANIVWILTRMGFRGATSEDTFNGYIKSLRKLELPVAGKDARRHGHKILYSYENAMDLVLAMTLRVYNSVPDAVLRSIVVSKNELHPIYRQAYEQRASGLGSQVRLGTRAQSFTVKGIFLDLNLNHTGGALVSFGPPRALSPIEALARFSEAGIAARAFAPIHLSCLAEKVVALSREGQDSDENA